VIRGDKNTDKNDGFMGKDKQKNGPQAVSSMTEIQKLI
jgi:hypothetical protein